MVLVKAIASLTKVEPTDHYRAHLVAQFTGHLHKSQGLASTLTIASPIGASSRNYSQS